MSWRDWWAGLWQGMTPADAWAGLFPAWWHLAGFLVALAGLWTGVLVAAVHRTCWEQTEREREVVAAAEVELALAEEAAVPLPTPVLVAVVSGSRR